jgi:hypothetical protein
MPSSGFRDFTTGLIGWCVAGEVHRSPPRSACGRTGGFFFACRRRARGAARRGGGRSALLRTAPAATRRAAIR